MAAAGTVEAGRRLRVSMCFASASSGLGGLTAEAAFQGARAGAARLWCLRGRSRASGAFSRSR